LAGYFEAREVKKVLLLVITSDRGLCGAFNANVVKRVRTLLDGEYAAAHKAGNVTLMCIGKKGGEALKRYGYDVNVDLVTLTQNSSSETSFAAMQGVIDAYLLGKYDRVEVVYNKFKNAATQILVNEQLLPIANNVSESTSASSDYIFEPGKIAILEDLIPRSLNTMFYRALLDSLASEHGARMVAMDKATENAGDLLRALRLAYNQARQAAITREISEIVGGVAALEG
jgi:F-type H+-transporting ATPase subunit gamma